MATYQEQIEATKKKKVAQSEVMRSWLISAIADGIAPLLVDGVLTKDQGTKLVTDILKSLSENKP